MDLELHGIPIILNEKLSPLQMKEKGFINGHGREIVKEVEVGETIYNKLMELKDD